ncbi:MAG: hypothetical protein JWM11_3466 [Planctomycetaceae bacterium]|nr:hypothetical protein [Planctomycetaceae bacterium]
MHPFTDSSAVDQPPSGALAIFVKTPELSSVKTRLARTLGLAGATRFYELAVSAIEAVACAARDLHPHATIPRLTPYWAVAEFEGLNAPQWSTLPRIYQGPGGLGTRLHSVYSQLLMRHSFVLLIGADSPQLPVETLELSCQTFLNQQDKACAHFLLGRTDDGGYYLFGGNQPIEQEIWESVPYSVQSTAAEFVQRLIPFGTVQELPQLFDIDTIEDLRRLGELYITRFELLEAQQQVIMWAKRCASETGFRE